MTPKEKKLLLENPLFKSVQQEIFEKGEKTWSEDSFKKGDIILSAEDFKRCLIFILKGKVAVYKIGAQGKKTLVNSLSEGDIFGMATLFYEADYPSEISAESACKVLIFPKESVEGFLEASPAFAREYIVLLSKKLHFLNKKMSTFAESEVSEKLLSFLKAESKGRTEFLPGISVSKLAESLNVGRASVYRAFESLAEENILVKKDKTIVILDPKRVF